MTGLAPAHARRGAHWLTAEAAVERVQDETRLRVQRLGDPILRERRMISTIWRGGCCAI